jgi:hypothetical protein
LFIIFLSGFLFYNEGVLSFFRLTPEEKKRGTVERRDEKKRASKGKDRTAKSEKLEFQNKEKK